MSTWMVVEDEPDLYDTLLALMEIWSIDGVAFTDGTDVIKWIEDVDEGHLESNVPELALLDIRLPGVSGPDIGHRLRQSPVLKNIAIVLTTAYHLTPQEEREVIDWAQADALMYKPLPSPGMFHQALQTAIAKRRAAAQSASPAAPPPEAPRPEIPRVEAPAASKPRTSRTPAPKPEK